MIDGLLRKRGLRHLDRADVGGPVASMEPPSLHEGHDVDAPKAAGAAQPPETQCPPLFPAGDPAARKLLFLVCAAYDFPDSVSKTALWAILLCPFCQALAALARSAYLARNDFSVFLDHNGIVVYSVHRETDAFAMHLALPKASCDPVALVTSFLSWTEDVDVLMSPLLREMMPRGSVRPCIPSLSVCKLNDRDVIRGGCVLSSDERKVVFPSGVRLDVVGKLSTARDIVNYRALTRFSAQASSEPSSIAAERLWVRPNLCTDILLVCNEMCTDVAESVRRHVPCPQATDEIPEFCDIVADAVSAFQLVHSLLGDSSDASCSLAYFHCIACPKIPAHVRRMLIKKHFKTIGLSDDFFEAVVIGGFTSADTEKLVRTMVNIWKFLTQDNIWVRDFRRFVARVHQESTIVWRSWVTTSRRIYAILYLTDPDTVVYCCKMWPEMCMRICAGICKDGVRCTRNHSCVTRHLVQAGIATPQLRESWNEYESRWSSCFMSRSGEHGSSGKGRRLRREVSLQAAKGGGLRCEPAKVSNLTPSPPPQDNGWLEAVASLEQRTDPGAADKVPRDGELVVRSDVAVSRFGDVASPSGDALDDDGGPPRTCAGADGGGLQAVSVVLSSCAGAFECRSVPCVDLPASTASALRDLASRLRGIAGVCSVHLIGSSIFYRARDIDVVVEVVTYDLEATVKLVALATGMHSPHNSDSALCLAGTCPCTGILLDVHIVQGRTMCAAFAGEDVSHGTRPDDIKAAVAVRDTHTMVAQLSPTQARVVPALHEWMDMALCKGGLFGRLPGIAVTICAVFLARRRVDFSPSLHLTGILRDFADMLYATVPRVSLVDNDGDDACVRQVPSSLQCRLWSGPEAPLSVIALDGETVVSSRMTTGTTRMLHYILRWALDHRTPLRSPSSLRSDLISHTVCVCLLRPKQADAVCRTAHTMLARMEQNSMVDAIGLYSAADLEVDPTSSVSAETSDLFHIRVVCSRATSSSADMVSRYVLGNSPTTVISVTPIPDTNGSHATVVCKVGDDLCGKLRRFVAVESSKLRPCPPLSSAESVLPGAFLTLPPPFEGWCIPNAPSLAMDMALQVPRSFWDIVL